MRGLLMVKNITARQHDWCGISKDVIVKSESAVETMFLKCGDLVQIEYSPAMPTYCRIDATEAYS